MNFNIKLALILLMSISLSCKSQDILSIKVGDSDLNIEIANDDEERSKGLMHRTELSENSGMLFVFDIENTVSFWMKNTTIPLSIAYINKKGVIMEIYDLIPLSTEPKTSKRSSILYALEVNRGYFERNNIDIGDKIEISKVYSYLKSSK